MAKTRITKVYTKTGDKGLTSLVGGERVSKASLRVDSYGDVDELNAVLGIIRSQGIDSEINSLIITIQNDLFIMGADLASPPDIEVPRVTQESISNLEQAIDKFLEELEPLKEFILPSGDTSGSYLHFGRTVSRRAERKVVKLMEEQEIGDNVLIYLNRLSDLLFVMARVQNQRNDFTETFVDFKK